MSSTTREWTERKAEKDETNEKGGGNESTIRSKQVPVCETSKKGREGALPTMWTNQF